MTSACLEYVNEKGVGKYNVVTSLTRSRLDEFVSCCRPGELVGDD